MKKSELNKILKEHKMWLEGNLKGVRANLSGADLSNANLSGADLSYANLSYANLSNANLSGADLSYADLSNANLSNANLSYANLSYANLSYANLSYADLRGADLSNANLSGANLSYANLSYADLSGADLSYADLSNANLSNANLSGADLSYAKYNEGTGFYALQCPERGSFIAYKTANGKIVELKVTEFAKRSSATTRKCRCSEAEVLSITSLDGKTNYKKVASNQHNEFIYKVGKIVKVDNFDENRWNECSTGIHFFITRDEAVQYVNN